MVDKTKKFIERAITIHGNFYDYSKVYYSSAKTKVIIRCPIHETFYQTPDHHLRGRGCKYCGIIKCAKALTDSTKSFIEKAEKNPQWKI